jgi:cystathionine beta-lyase/cystathionine gamma-synthase
MTHASVSEAERSKLGISDSMCRLSIGIEEVEDILKDIKDALDAVEL